MLASGNVIRPASSNLATSCNPLTSSREPPPALVKDIYPARRSPVSGTVRCKIIKRGTHVVFVVDQAIPARDIVGDQRDCPAVRSHLKGPGHRHGPGENRIRRSELNVLNNTCRDRFAIRPGTILHELPNLREPNSPAPMPWIACSRSPCRGRGGVADPLPLLDQRSPSTPTVGEIRSAIKFRAKAPNDKVIVSNAILGEIELKIAAVFPDMKGLLVPKNAAAPTQEEVARN